MKKRLIAFYILLVACFMPFVNVHAEPTETSTTTVGEYVGDGEEVTGDVIPDEPVNENEEVDDKAVETETKENNPTTGVFLDSISVLFLLGICVLLLHLVNKKLIFRV